MRPLADGPNNPLLCNNYEVKSMDNPIKNIDQYPDVLNVVQVSELLRVSTKSVYKLVNDKIIPSLRIGRAYRIPKRSLLRYLKTAS